jgi:hypothetical protein
VPDNLKGDYALAQFLVAERLATQQGLDPLLKRIAAEREPNVAQGLCLSLIDLVVEQQTAKLEDILLAILNKSGKPYLPLSCYDVDRETACLLPREVAFGGGVVPFDQMSRSVLVATSNPFDPVAAEQVQSMLDYNIFWYIAMPADITAALRRAHGYENAKKGGA